MRRTLPLLAALVLVLACNELFSPYRTNTYEFRCIPGGAIRCADTVAFHWTRDLLPVRVWVASDDALADDVALGLERWQGAFLYGELQAVLVSDSSQADIVVRNIFPPEGSSGIGARAIQCRGETDYDLPAADTLRLPMHIFVWSNTTPPAAGTDVCFRLTVTHELGHAFGILSHSPDNGDVMYADPVFDGVSERDRETIETAYRVPSTLHVIGRR